MSIYKYLFIVSLSLMYSCSSGPTEVEERIVVIGGGLMGSSTAWQLARRDESVLMLEKQDTSYTTGSSLGVARIARSNNRNDDIWSYLHNRSVAEVQALIKYLNETDDLTTHRMKDIYTTGPVTYVGRKKIYDKLLASLRRQDVEYDMATTQIQGADMYQVNLPDNVLMQREYNPYSGTINPAALISYLHKAISRSGGEIRYNSEVIGLSFDKATQLYHITVVNDNTDEQMVIKAHKVVSAAGPYTGKLLRTVAPYFQRLIDPQRVFLAFLKIRKEIYDQWSEDQIEKLKTFYPVINSAEGTRRGSAFSMIEYYTSDDHPVIKIGGHFQRSPIEDLDRVWSMDLSDEEITWSKSKTHEYLQMLNLPISYDDLELVKGYSCVYSLTETEVPYVTPIVYPSMQTDYNCIVLGGMSGVGGKGAMAYGLIAADLMTGEVQIDSLYKVVRDRLGVQRLQHDLN